ncbi:hypothetical protein P154DRAFT_525138 [Amniculicola lignicola CBS 123094]|uniref:F-box domain-containing protein n=1 Tax=Amniculicola lignicola CBS 123094 TaxID=1392246 RepID=A0A6A5W8S3_9PLEO|nr:hypothetical protein P154DRAFT_525138 [Amniculicola lignicola CBS 123094]
MSTDAPNLHTLPTELLLNICLYLSPPSVACLTLITRRTYLSLPHTSFPKRMTNTLSEYKALLHYLSTSNPRWAVCECCISLHDKDAIVPGYANPGGAGLTTMFRGDLVGLGRAKAKEPLIKIEIGKGRCVYEIGGGDTFLAMLRSGRNPGSMFEKGICVRRFDRSGEEMLKVYGVEKDATIARATKGKVVKAKICWETEARISRPSLRFMLLTTYTLIPSFPFAEDLDFKNLKSILNELSLQCCKHCPASSVSREVICKLRQLLHETKNCVSAQSQPDFRCGEHWHKCECRADVEVLVENEESGDGGKIVIKMWRMLRVETGLPAREWAMYRETIKSRFEWGIKGS